MISLLRLLWSRLRSLVSKDRLDRNFDDELAGHLELLIDDTRKRGLSEPRRDAKPSSNSAARLRIPRPDRYARAITPAVTTPSVFVGDLFFTESLISARFAA